MRPLRVDELGDDDAINRKVGRSAAWLGVRGLGLGLELGFGIGHALGLGLAPLHAHQCPLTVS